MTAAPAIQEHEIYLDDGNEVPIDVETLITSKALVAASSGGGKSWLVRCILERTHTAVQQIVLDRDGEFHTLRERFDYILFSDNGDFPVMIAAGDHDAKHPRDTYAGRLAMKLLDLGVSAIIDLSSLGPDQDLFVGWFCAALMHAPRDLWHPAIIVIDECHRFAPENGRGRARSAEAVRELATDGRKRGFCLIAATQRTADLHNSVIAQLHNRMIGMNVLADDIDRARRAIRMKAAEADEVLPMLEPGTFYVIGPALTRTVKRIRVGKVVTTHPKAGQGILRPTPPRARIRQLLGQLDDVKQSKPAEPTVAELQARIRELESNQAVRESWESPESVHLKKEVASLRSLEQMYETLHETQCKSIDSLLEYACTMKRHVSSVVDGLLELRNSYVNALETHVERETPTAISDLPEETIDKMANSTFDIPSRLIGGAELGRRATEAGETGGKPMSRVMRAFLTVLAQFGAKAKGEILQIAQYASSGATSTAFAQMLQHGWAQIAGPGRLEITPAGVTALGDWKPLPTGEKLREVLFDEANGRLSKPERAILRVACRHYPKQIGKGAVLREANYASSGGTSTAFARLIVMGYLTQPVANHVRAGEILFK